MLVFKFGGASVRDAASVKNVCEILSKFSDETLIVVVSAMGKVTNLLESTINAKNSEERIYLLEKFEEFHSEIAHELNIYDEFGPYMQKRIEHIKNIFSLEIDEHHTYDEVVSQGELSSTYLINLFLKSQNLDTQWLDACTIIKTLEEHKVTQVDWAKSTTECETWKQTNNLTPITITQGFIGSNSKKETTTLGREGSDFSASIIAFLFNATSVTIWKDVPGMLNADPRKFPNTVKLNQISYREAIELAYYGASVIHPKTVKPLQNKSIPLFVKSFLQPGEPGTMITDGVDMNPLVPSYISSEEQTLVSFTPNDFSFIGEKELSHIFKVLSDQKVTVNLMQNSAISFSIVFKQELTRLKKVIELLEGEFKIRYNEDLELLTIRHYDNHILENLTEKREILLEQRSRSTIRLVMSTKTSI